MNQATEPPPYGIGACLNCTQVFLITPIQRSCPLCLRPPRQWLAFGVGEGEALAAPVEIPAYSPPEALGLIVTLDCPSCQAPLALYATPEGLRLELQQGVEPATDAADASKDAATAATPPATFPAGDEPVAAAGTEAPPAAGESAAASGDTATSEEGTAALDETTASGDVQAPADSNTAGIPAAATGTSAESVERIGEEEPPASPIPWISYHEPERPGDAPPGGDDVEHVPASDNDIP